MSEVKNVYCNKCNKAFCFEKYFLNLIIWLIFPFLLFIIKWKFYIPMKHTQLLSFLIPVHMVWQAWIQNIFSWVRVNAWSLLWAYGSIFYCSSIYKYFLAFIKLYRTNIQPCSCMEWSGILCALLCQMVQVKQSLE